MKHIAHSYITETWSGFGDKSKVMEKTLFPFRVTEKDEMIKERKEITNMPQMRLKLSIY